MKQIRIFLALISLLVTLPLGVYQSWLLYSHIHATDVMWLLWWITIPLTATFTIINTIVEKMEDKKE